METHSMPSKLPREEINAKARAAYARRVAGEVHLGVVQQDEAIRETSRVAGLKTFPATNPCAAGHLERYVSDGKCAVCVRQRAADARKNNPELAKARFDDWYARNTEQLRTYRKTYYQNNIDALKAAMKEDYIENREARLAYEVTRRAANPDLYKIRDTNKRARQRGAKGSHTLDEIKHLFQKQRGRCAYFRVCGNRISMGRGGFHKDHITAVINGGSNFISNIQLTCGPCNMHKHTDDPLVFARKNGMLL